MKKTNPQFSGFTQWILGGYAWAHRKFGSRVEPGSWVFDRAYTLYKAWYEDGLRAHLRRFPLGPGHVLDVGAHTGYTSRLLRRHVKAPFHVFAFEPEELNFKVLSRAAKEGIEPLRYAIGARSANVFVHPNPDHPGDHRIVESWAEGRQAVPMISIDEFVRSRRLDPQGIALVKIDVQGHEKEVLEGMQGLLRENPSVRLVVEWEPTSQEGCIENSSLLANCWQAGQGVTDLGHHAYAIHCFKRG